MNIIETQDPETAIKSTPATRTPEMEIAGDAVNVDLIPRADTTAILVSFRSKIESLRATAATLKVTSIEDRAGQQLARVTRLQIRQIRLESDKKREEMVGEMTKEVKTINAGFKLIWDDTSSLEANLKEQEEFIERETARLEQELRIKRINEIREYLTSPPAVDLGTMEEAAYQALLQDSREIHQLRETRKAKEEADRKAKEEEEAAERERIRLENVRLKQEVDKAAEALQNEREANEKRQAEERRIQTEKAAEERKKSEEERQRIEDERRKEREAAAEIQRAAEAVIQKQRDQAAQERASREKIERDQADLRWQVKQAEKKRLDDEAEAKRIKEAEEAETLRQAALAPDKSKLESFAAEVSLLSVPALSASSQGTQKEITQKIQNFANWIRKQAAAL